MCIRDSYYDVRIFGAVMTTGKSSAGKLTGPVTVGIGRSLDPVLPMDLGITRTASTQEEKKDNASQMGSKTVIPYGSVSYTHLDVYKRQPQARAQHPANAA